MLKIISSLFAVALVVAGPAMASDDDLSKAIKDTKVVTLDPASSYLIVQTNSASSMYSFGIAFIRRPDQADLIDYARRRQEALGKAHDKWVKRHAQWQADKAAWEHLPASAQKGVKKPAEPVEPNDQNLSFPAIDMENILPIGPFNRFSKANGRSTFVQRVKPGRYAFYGPMIFAQGVGGTCMCMGTVQFEIGPGEIVNAGMMTLSFLDAYQKAKTEGSAKPKTMFDLPSDIGVIKWAVPDHGSIDDPRLAAFKIIPATLHAAGRIPNYYGVEIDRLTVIPGILEYDRDRVVDARTGKIVP